MATGTSSALVALSDALAGAVESAGRSIVRVDDGTRLTASGIVWNQDGIVVATSHGVEADEGVEIETSDGLRFPVSVVARDEETDIAVLRAKTQTLNSIAYSDSSDVGRIVLAIGRPGRAGLQATLGIVSARTSVRNGSAFLLHTDATLYPGFSGGALVDADGCLVGMLNLSHGRGRGVALSTGLIAETVDQLLQHGQIRRGYLGVSSQPVKLPEALRGRIGLDQGLGLLVSFVEAESGAEKAGMLVGDIIVRMDGQGLSDPSDLRRKLRSKSPGDAVNLGIVRGGALQDLAVTLGAAQP